MTPLDAVKLGPGKVLLQIMDPYTANTRKAVRRFRFPWFRRVLAPFGLVSTVIVVGITAAALTIVAFMGVLFIVEQAVG